jgi:hypothetical protein
LPSAGVGWIIGFFVVAHCTSISAGVPEISVWLIRRTIVVLEAIDRRHHAWYQARLDASGQRYPDVA